MQFTDTAEMAGTRVTADGYLVASVLCARTGCQDYLGTEIGLVDADVVSVFRPKETVFARDSMESFPGKPITIDHPPEGVNADNWKDKAGGDIVAVVPEGEFIRADIKIMDGAAIKAIEDGKREISMGYSTPIEIKDGVAPDGTAFGAVQTGPIKINHLALVDRARGGQKLRIGDGAVPWGAAPITMSDKKEDDMSDALKTVVFGDKAAQVAAADVNTIEQFKTDTASKLSDMQTTHDAALAAKDKEIAAKDAEIDKLKGSVLSDADLDAKVQARADLVDTARKIDNDVEPKGLSDADIRKAVVAAKLGDAALEGKSDAYIEARFDVLAEDADNVDPVAQALQNGPIHDASATEADKAYAENLTNLSDAWKGGEQKEA
jgi:hypothetical protein